jgi:hypothetical protein
VLDRRAGLVWCEGRAAVLPEVLQEGDAMTDAERFLEAQTNGNVSLPMRDGSELYPTDVRWSAPGAAEVVADYELGDGRVMQRHVGLAGREQWSIAGRIGFRIAPESEPQPVPPASLN